MDEPLSTDRWRRIEDLFEAALDRSPEQRAAFLDGACGGDSQLRREVADLVAADSEAEGFLDAPVRGAPLAQELPTMSAGGSAPGGGVPGERGALAPDTVLAGRFRILRFLDSGGMGEVYEALDVELDERLALKTVRPELAGRPDVVERLRREVRLAHQVTHPSVCRTFDLFRHEDSSSLTFLTMELLHGETLKERMDDPLLVSGGEAGGDLLHERQGLGGSEQRSHAQTLLLDRVRPRFGTSPFRQLIRNQLLYH